MLLKFLEVVEMVGDEDGFIEEDKRREGSSYICSGASCASPPFPAHMCPNLWSRRPSGVLTFP